MNQVERRTDPERRARWQRQFDTARSSGLTEQAARELASRSLGLVPRPRVDGPRWQRQHPHRGDAAARL